MLVIPCPCPQVEGEWNGRMVGKWASGKTETFLDVTRLPATKKMVRPVAEQEKHESRSGLCCMYLEHVLDPEP